jgi:hypothetical protein
METNEALLEKETTTDWPNYVRAEIAALLDIYLPVAKNGNVGIRYKKPIISTDEGGAPVAFDNTKAEAVSINLVFEFDRVIDIPK